MDRVVCVWLPNWPLQRLRHEQPELRDVPLVLHSPDAGRGSCVLVCCAAAKELGIVVGMPLAEAQAVAHFFKTTDRLAKPRLHREPNNQPIQHPPVFFSVDHQRDLKALETLAHTCEPFSPQIGIETAESPECLLLNVTGCVHLFGDEHQLLAEIARSFVSRGLETRLAAAATVGAAWGAAHRLSRPDKHVVLEGDQATATLEKLPVEMLRLPSSLIATLHELGLYNIGQVRRLPRSNLPSRFDKQLLRRMDQMFGVEPELVEPLHPPEPIAVTWAGEEPFFDRDWLRHLCGDLLKQLLAKLVARRDGIRELLFQARGTSGRPREQRIRLVKPSDSAKHLLELLDLQLERTEMHNGILFVRLEAVQIQAIQHRPTDLFGGDPAEVSRREVHSLLDRLSNRLGSAAVSHARLVADPQPERACCYEPVVAAVEPQEKKGRPRQAEHHNTTEHHRPLKLFATPQLILVLKFAAHEVPLRFRWNHVEYQSQRHWGPERIETGWWRDTPIRRDYFRIETTTGQHLWLFRERSHPTSGSEWFVHGEFD